MQKVIGNLTETVDIYGPNQFHSVADWTRLANWQKAVNEHEVVVYNGHSALGTKSADVLMKITGCIAAVWILLAMVLVLVMDPRRAQTTMFGSGPAQEPAGQGAPAVPGQAGGAAPAADDSAGKADAQAKPTEGSGGGSLSAPAETDSNDKTGE